MWIDTLGIRDSKGLEIPRHRRYYSLLTAVPQYRSSPPQRVLAFASRMHSTRHQFPALLVNFAYAIFQASAGLLGVCNRS